MTLIARARTFRRCGDTRASRQVAAGSTRRSVSLMALAFAGVMLAACGATQPTRFYTLAPVTTPDPLNAAATEDIVLGLGPVSVASYLDRPEIVTRSGRNRIVLADIDVWSEPLATTLTRLLREQLVDRLGTQEVFILPAPFSTDLDYRISLDIIRFDTDENGQTVLQSRWRLFDRGGDRLIRTEFSDISMASAPPPDFDSITAGMSASLAQLGDELALAVVAARVR